MNWKVIRLELASSWEFPRGSVGRSYLIRLPLTDEGAIDMETLESQPAHATVRRYWPNQADMLGHLVRTPMGYAIRYEANGRTGSDGAEPALFQFGADAIKVGEQIFLEQPVRQTSTLLAIRHAYALLDELCPSCPRRDKAVRDKGFYFAV